MRHHIAVTLIGLVLATSPAFAQDNTDPVPNDTVSEDTDADGNFSRIIPEGLKTELTEQEIADFQARLNAAATPQERNAIRMELQRTNQERHQEKVQATQQKQPQNKQQKGFFGSMRDDFSDIVSGKASKDAKAAKDSKISNDELKQNGKSNGGEKSNKGGNSSSNSNSGGKNK
jgi:hypothetical protein